MRCKSKMELENKNHGKNGVKQEKKNYNKKETSQGENIIDVIKRHFQAKLF